jgi:HAD superfamily hydrolase (TIGR01509 family)
MQSRPYDLVIFDCDGVLVDSELLSARVLTTQLAEAGIDLSIEDFQQHFLGRKFAVAVEDLAQRTHIRLPNDFESLYSARLLRLFERELQPINGVLEVLQRLSIDYCVASGSLPQRLNCALKVCGMLDYLGARVYSSALVTHTKPAPDLFLHASRIHAVDASRCLVIEDSEMGVLAANAAGMDVWHFTGGSHMKEGYSLSAKTNVAKVVRDMSQLQKLFCEIGISHVT